jgi:hypothetical protein
MDDKDVQMQHDYRFFICYIMVTTKYRCTTKLILHNISYLLYYGTSTNSYKILVQIPTWPWKWTCLELIFLLRLGGAIEDGGILWYCLVAMMDEIVLWLLTSLGKQAICLCQPPMRVSMPFKMRRPTLPCPCICICIGYWTLYLTVNLNTVFISPRATKFPM